MVAAIVAGALAAGVRYGLSRAFVRRGVAVLVVNVVASAIGGTVLGLAIRGDVGADIRLILLSGLCGGLSTFSTFSVETIQFTQHGKWRDALLSVTANLVLGVGAAAIACAVVLALA